METLELNDLLRFFLDSAVTGPVRKGGCLNYYSFLFSLSHFYHKRHNIFELNHSCLQYVEDHLFLQVFVE